MDAGKPDRTLFFDDLLYSSGAENCFPFESCFESRFAGCEFYVGLGYRHLRTKTQLSGRLLAENRKLPSFIHPTCFVASSSNIGEGTLLYPMCNVDAECQIGMGVLINNSVVVSHNCSISDGSYLSPGVVLSGKVSVGECSFLGAGTIVADGIRIGAGARVGLATSVTKEVLPGDSVIGNPMRVLKRPLKL
jgi:UDP-perosamine 4-acetyltransferase